MANILPQVKKNHGCFKTCLIILFTPILLIAGVIFFATAEWRRSDEDILKNYKPTSEIADIAQKNMLSDKGKATFFRADPVLVDATSFMKDCRTQASKVESLACTAPRAGGYGPFASRQIYLLKIDDPKFSDHKYSAAAHEMLHIAYMHLSSDEKKRLAPLLDQELEKHKNDTHLVSVTEILKSRKDKKIEDIREELHSKFGVEYADISPELEDYYKQYFDDRKKIVTLYKNGGFNSRVRRMDEIAGEIKSLNSRLINTQGQLAAYKNSGDYANYNKLVAPFNNLVSQYNARVAESNKIYNEVLQFYKYFDPDYKPPEPAKN